MSTVYTHYDILPHFLPVWASRIKNFQLHALNAVPSVCKPSSFPFCIVPTTPHQIRQLHTVESLYNAYATFNSDYWMFEAWNKELLASLTPEEITQYLQTCKLDLNVDIKRLCSTYVDNVFAYINGTKLKHPQTDVETEPNARLMQEVEEKISVTEQLRHDFRLMIVGMVSNLGNRFTWDSNARLKKALELTIAGNNKSWEELQRKNFLQPKPSSKNNPKTCNHQWGIDGAHSNEYCKVCFIAKEEWDYNPMRMSTIAKPIAQAESGRWNMSNFAIGVQFKVRHESDTFSQFTFEDINQSGYGEAFNIFYARRIERCGGPRISTMPRATPAEDAFNYMQTLLTNPRCIIKRSDIHKPMEALIAKDGHMAYKYAKLINAPFPEGEAAIAKTPIYSFDYATKILKKRFKAGESAIYFSELGSKYQEEFHDVTYVYVAAEGEQYTTPTVFPNRVKCFINDRPVTVPVTVHTIEQLNSLPLNTRNEHLCPIHFNDWVAKSLNVQGVIKYRKMLINANVQPIAVTQFYACDKVIQQYATPDELLEYTNLVIRAGGHIENNLFALYQKVARNPYTLKYKNITLTDQSGSMGGIEIRSLPSNADLEKSIKAWYNSAEAEDELLSLQKKPNVYVKEPSAVVDDLLNKQLAEPLDSISIPSSPPPLQPDTFFKTRPLPDSYPNPMRNLWPMAASGFFMIIFGFIQVIRVVFKYDGWNLTLGIYGLVFGIFAVLHYVGIMQGEQAQLWKKRDEEIAKRKAIALINGTNSSGPA